MLKDEHSLSKIWDIDIILLKINRQKYNTNVKQTKEKKDMLRVNAVSLEAVTHTHTHFMFTK